MRKSWWLSCSRFTIKAIVKSGVIVDAAPIVKRFVGQPLSNLRKWMISLGGFRSKEMV